MSRIIGYGVVGPNEKRLEQTLDCFKKLCDETILCLNLNQENESLVQVIKSYGFSYVYDGREWGKHQHQIKEDFIRAHVAPLNPDVTICLDMDEVLVAEREDIEKLKELGGAWYVFIVNLWEEGWKKQWSFWNVRIWFWDKDRQEQMKDEFLSFIKRPLHCGLSPQWCYYTGNYSPILLLHYGLKDKEDRERKILRYNQYDPQARYRDRSYYESLKSDTFEPFNQEALQEQISKELATIKQKRKFSPIMNQEEIVWVVRQKDGARLAIPKKHLEETIKRGGFHYDGEAVQTRPIVQQGKTMHLQVEEDPFECPICGHISANEQDTTTHRKTHI